MNERFAGNSLSPVGRANNVSFAWDHPPSPPPLPAPVAPSTGSATRKPQDQWAIPEKPEAHPGQQAVCSGQCGRHQHVLLPTSLWWWWRCCCCLRARVGRSLPHRRWQPVSWHQSSSWPSRDSLCRSQELVAGSRESVFLPHQMVVVAPLSARNMQQQQQEVPYVTLRRTDVQKGRIAGNHSDQDQILPAGKTGIHM